MREQVEAFGLASETGGDVLFSLSDRGRYATDASIYQAMPVGAFVPSTTPSPSESS